MSVTPSSASRQAIARFQYPIVLGTSVALGADLLLALSATAADKWGPGCLMPASLGIPGASHIVVYGPPGQTLSGVGGLAYRADAEPGRYEAADGYGPATGHSKHVVVETGLTSAGGGAT